MTDIAALRADLGRTLAPGTARLTSAVTDIDKVIEALTNARAQIAEASSLHTASTVLARLQAPTKAQFEAINEDLRKVDKVRKDIGKNIDKRFPLKPLPTEDDTLGEYTNLINRAIAMHLLREGQFTVATAFIKDIREAEVLRKQQQARHAAHFDTYDDEMGGMELDGDDDEVLEGDDQDNNLEETVPDDAQTSSIDVLGPLQSEQLQEQFATMYKILSELKRRNCTPALDWARSNASTLETRGSSLEFELSKLQYIWLSREDNGEGNKTGTTMTGCLNALRYAQATFPRFTHKYKRDIEHLVAAMALFPPTATTSTTRNNSTDRTYASEDADLDVDSDAGAEEEEAAAEEEPHPYSDLFDTTTLFSTVHTSFTREFCSTLGLPAESPLYIAATAGAIALPRVMKYLDAVKTKRTEWTTSQELAFETPLPDSMVFHSIFVCPVSKEQTTQENPPVLLQCGHVLAKESLQRLVKGHSTKYKCPYCPVEGHIKDTKQIIL